MSQHNEMESFLGRPPGVGIDWELVYRDASPYHTTGMARWVPPGDPAIEPVIYGKSGHSGISAFGHMVSSDKVIKLTRNPTAPTRRKVENHPKGWGKETWLANTPQYCGKLLCFNKGAKFSAHFHDLKNETFYVLKGKVKLTWFNLQNADEIVEVLIEGEVIDIPRLCVHQVEALEESVIIEVSTQHLETDSYRVRKGDSQNFKTVWEKTIMQ